MITINRDVQHLGIKESNPRIVLTIGEVQVLLCFSLEVTTRTYEESAEAIRLSGKAIMDINLAPVEEKALESMSYGESQARLAKAGGYPCENCGDCYLDSDGSCRNEDRCKAWGIYSNQY